MKFLAPTVTNHDIIALLKGSSTHERSHHTKTSAEILFELSLNIELSIDLNKLSTPGRMKDSAGSCDHMNSLWSAILQLSDGFVLVWWVFRRIFETLNLTIIVDTTRIMALSNRSICRLGNVFLSRMRSVREQHLKVDFNTMSNRGLNFNSWAAESLLDERQASFGKLLLGKAEQFEFSSHSNPHRFYLDETILLPTNANCGYALIGFRSDILTKFCKRHFR